MIIHIGRLLTISVAEETTNFNNHRAARLSALKLLPSKPRNLGFLVSQRHVLMRRLPLVDQLTLVPTWME